MSRLPRPLETDRQLVLPDFVSAQDGERPSAQGSVEMRRVMAMAARAAPVTSTVLITGETGVGKERLARWLHGASRRRDRPFFAVNCGAFAETLLESELFGYARGAFTGAITDHPGLFEAAHGGTFFLDEIGEMSPAMQVRLLRVLQEREVRRIGETRSRPVDVRLIAATHRDLADEMRAGSFRADLYYRLRVIELAIPPLRERATDLAGLLHTLLPPIAAKVGAAVEGYTPTAWSALMHYPWPGNVRELEHAIERACVMATGDVIDVGDLPECVRDVPERTATAHASLAERERLHVARVVAAHGGDRRRAAEALGISPSTLKRRLRASTTPRVAMRGPAHD